MNRIDLVIPARAGVSCRDGTLSDHKPPVAAAVTEPVR
jgi:hypothetical protein